MNTTLHGVPDGSAEVVGEFEELVWLEHQQQRHGEGQLALAWRLGESVDYGRLVNALTQALVRLPGANLRYEYDDEAGLRRRSAAEAPPTVAIQAVSHPRQAVERLLEEKATPLDLAAAPPVRFRLFVAERGGVLGMVMHRIALASLSCRAILQAVSALYHGRPCPLHSAPPTPPRALPQPDGGGLRARFMPFPCADAPEAGRTLRAPLPASSAEERHALLAARFAHALSEITGSPQIALSLADDSGDGAPVALACAGQTTSALCARIRQHLRGDAPLPAASQTQVPLRVVWRDDAHAALRLEAEEASPLPLPPGHTVWPLTVALSAEPLVEIEVGAQLAGWVGEWLLARVLQWEETAPQPAAETIAKPASDEVRERILAAFREALAAPEMGEDDDFFDFGGHSLIATRIIGRLKSLHQIELNINDLFSYPSAAALASKVNMAEPPPVPEPCASVATAGAQAPLSLAQQSLWKIYQALGFSEAFNIPFALRFLEPIDEEIFRQAFADILLRHPALRTLFVTIAGEIYQQVVPPEMLSRYDWFSFSTRSAALPLREALGDEAGHRFRLDDELPVRITFLRDEANGQQVVSLLFHHIVLDEWSVNILMDELAHAVNRRSAGRAPEWRQTPEPFHLFALRQRAAGLNDSHLHFWLERLRGAPAATPVLAPRQADTETSDPAGGWTEFRLEAAVSEGLYRLARRRGASLFNVVYSGIAAALHGLGGMEELTIGTSASGRNDARFFDTIGYFTTVVAHRVDFRRTATLNALIDDVKQQINASMPFTDIPIDLVEEGLFDPAVAHDRHMFEVFIQIHAKNKLNGAFILGDGREVRFRQIDPQKSESVLGLQFEVMEENIAGESFIRVMMSYRADRYTPEQVRQIVGTTHRAFAAMADVDDGADVPLAALCAAAVNTQ